MVGLAILVYLIAVTIGSIPRATAASCTDTWVGENGEVENNWQSPDLWSAKRVPTKSDAVCIGAGKTVYILDGTTATVGSIQDEGTLRLSGGTLNFSESSYINNFFEADRSILSGKASLKTNYLKWVGGTMTNGGSLILLPNGTGGAIYGGGIELSAFQLVNQGTFLMAYTTRLVEKNGAEFRNEGLLNFNSAYENGFEDGGGEPPSVVNLGTIEKTEFDEVGEIEPRLYNYGSIVVRTGQILIKHPAGAQASASTPNHACVVDPIDCATGNLTETQSDLRIGGRGVGLELARTYSAQAAQASKLGIFGFGWSNSFGASLIAEEGGSKETLTDASGETVQFKKSGSSWVAPLWSQDSLTGSSASGFVLTLPNQTQEKFAAGGRLESVTDRNGNQTTLSYGTSGKLEAITDPTGRKITLTYNVSGLVEKAKDPMGHEVKYAYEGKSLKSVTLPGAVSPTWQFEYDGSNRLTAMTNGRGGKTTNEYDASNRVVSQVDPASRQTTFAYAGFHTVITNRATGAVSDEWFNSFNQPISITHGYGTPAASTETFGYTAAGLLVSQTDGNGHTTSYGYDSRSNLTSERDAEGDETKWTYNEAHQVLSETAPNGETTSIERDARGNPEKVSRPAPGGKAQTVSFKHGVHGELESATDALGHTWIFEYGTHGDRRSEVDPEGDKRTWTYDEDSRMTSTVAPRGNEAGTEPAKFTTLIERDLRGRPVKVTDPLGKATKYSYDASGNLESTTDPNGRKVKFVYDADDELTKVERQSGAVEETSYDGAGQVTSQTDGTKDKTTYVRNVLEQPVETIDPLERKTFRSFDAAGHLKTIKDPEGRATSFGYDKANRLKEISYSTEPTKSVTFAYNSNDDLTSMKDVTGESTFEYDQLDRLTHSKNGSGESAGWEYNLDDQPSVLTYPNGKSVSRGYDKAGRLQSVTDWLGHTTTVGYNRDSEPIVTTFPVSTGDLDEYGYDRAGRMSSVAIKKGTATLASLSYVRDPAGQLESLTSKGLPGTETESFGYDEDERLKKAGIAEFAYDLADRITKAPGTTNAYDRGSQIESATGAIFVFDKEGDRIKRTPSTGVATSYKYDQAGNVTAVQRPAEGKTPAIAESFAYDGADLMASRTAGSTTRHLVWNAAESPEQLLTDGEASYIYGPGGLPIEQISSSGVPTYLHHDQLGSTRLLTDASGSSVGTFTYGPYGEMSGSTGTAKTALGYAGQYTLAQSGLQFLRARFYDPTTAQFLNRDPAVLRTRRPYGYAADQPINVRDRTGSASETLDGGYCPNPFCFPAPTVGDAEGAAEAIEGIPGEIAAAGSNLWHSIAGDEEPDSAAEAEAEEASDCAVPPDLSGLTPKIKRQLGTRGWTREEIEEAFEKGEQVDAVNKANGNPATRYINPKSGKSVVIDNETGQVIQVGGEGFKFGPDSGDLQ